MSHDQTNGTDRRTFLQAGALATAAALGATSGAEAQDAPAKTPVLPKRKLGRTGLEITMLEMGTGALRERGVLERLLRLSYASGVRTFDTAKMYGTEPGFKKWFEQSPEVRKEIVLVTKDNPRAPKDMLAMLDKRLEALGDRLRRPVLHPRPRRRAQARRRHELRQGAGIQGDGRGDPQVGQGEVRRLLEPPQASRPDHPGGGRWRDHRRDHAPVHALARQGRPAEQGARRLPREGDRPDLDEADRRPVPLRREAGCPQGGRQARADAGREEPDAVPGPAARDLDRRADQRLLRLDQDDRPAPRGRRRRPPLRAAEDGGDRAAPRRGAGLRPDPLRRLRRPMLGRRRHQGRAGRPDPVPDLPRAPRHPHRGPPPVRRALPRGPRLVRRRPRGRPRRLPQQARLRLAPPRGRTAPGLSRSFRRTKTGGPVAGVVPGRPFGVPKRPTEGG